MKTMLALLKREILEHSSIWKVPLIMLVVSGLVKLSMLTGNISGDGNTLKFISVVLDFFGFSFAVNSAIDVAVLQSMWLVNGLISFVMIVVSIFYALSCLYSERQDQSVLFWRSLPISDATTVVSKLVIAVLLIPVLIVLSHVLVSMVFLGVQSIGYLQQSALVSIVSTMKIVAWLLLPLVAWCIFCSAIAKKGPFLLAFVVPIILIIIDSFFLNFGLSHLIIGRFDPNNYDSTLLLLSGFGLSVVCICFATIKRSQRI